MTTALAAELNRTIQKEAPDVFEMLSGLGRELYFPKGILTQSAEAKQKASRYNATIGIAREHNVAMHLPSVMRQFASLSPDDTLPYAPSFGLPALRAKWREHIQAVNPSLAGQAISLPVVTGGVTHGLSLVADLFVNAGDTVLIPDQVWGNYNMVFKVRREARMVKYPFFSGYFMCLRLKSLNAEAYRLRLLERCGIGVIATAPTDIRVAFSCIEEKDIADLFERMFLCAKELAAEPGGGPAVPDSAFEE